MDTLASKLKKLKRQKVKEIQLPIEMLKEAIGYSNIDVFIDESVDEKYYCIDNIESYTVKIPRKINLYSSYDDGERNKLKHVVKFKNGKSFEMPFSYVEFYKSHELDKRWEKEIFPSLEDGELCLAGSHICYLIQKFTEVLIDGVHNVSWDHEIEEGTPVIVIEKVNIDDLYFTKVLYDGQLYWCFGALTPDKLRDTFNPHYI